MIMDHPFYNYPEEKAPTLKAPFFGSKIDLDYNYYHEKKFLEHDLLPRDQCVGDFMVNMAIYQEYARVRPNS